MIQIAHQDCFEFLKSVPSNTVDLVLVDPPYEISRSTNFASGVAKALSDKYPKVKECYLELCETVDSPEDVLGLGQIVDIHGDGSLCVINAFTQLDYGYDGKKYTDEELLCRALMSMASYAKQKKATLYIPYRIGCDLDGGNWEHIEKFIIDHDLDIVAVAK